MTDFPTHTTEHFQSPWRSTTQHDVFPGKLSVSCPSSANPLTVWLKAQAHGSTVPMTDLTKRGPRPHDVSVRIQLHFHWYFKTAVIFYVAPCGLVEIGRRFRYTYWLISGATGLVHSVQQKSSRRNIVIPKSEVTQRWRRRTAGEIIRVVLNPLAFVRMWLFYKFHLLQLLMPDICYEKTPISLLIWRKTWINVNDCSQ
jgi:hypothetical protein